jgi:outer membrane protein
MPSLNRVRLIVLIWAQLFAAGSWAQVGVRAIAKIAFVDSGRLLDSAPQMSAGRSQLEREFAPRNQLLVADETNLKSLREQKLKTGSTISKSESDLLDRKIQTLERSVQRQREDLQNRLQARTNELMGKINQQIAEAVAEEARAQGYDAVMGEGATYVDPRFDITDGVLERLRARK